MIWKLEIMWMRRFFGFSFIRKRTNRNRLKYRINITHLSRVDDFSLLGFRRQRNLIIKPYRVDVFGTTLRLSLNYELNEGAFIFIEEI